MVPEAAPAVGAIDARRLVDVTRDALQTGEQDEDNQRRRLPEVGERDGEHAAQTALLPVDGNVDDAEIEQYLVEVAIEAYEVEHGGARDDGRHTERDEDDRAEEPSAAELAGQHQGDGDADCHLHRHSDDRNAEGVDEGVPELA